MHTHTDKFAYTVEICDYVLPVFWFLGRARIGRVLLKLLGHERLELVWRVCLVEVVNQLAIVWNCGIGRNALAAVTLRLFESCELCAHMVGSTGRA